FDASFWRKPLLSFLFLTPICIFLWRFFFKNIFNIIPFTKNVLYIYDNEGKYHEDLLIINGEGNSDSTCYKVKLSYLIGSSTIREDSIFVKSLSKIDSFILNLESYNEIPTELE